MPKLRALTIQQSLQHMDVPVYAQFAAYYGNQPDFLDVFARRALDGNGPFAAASDGARAEAAEKTVINSLLPLASLVALYEARSMARDGHTADGQVRTTPTFCFPDPHLSPHPDRAEQGAPYELAVDGRAC